MPAETAINLHRREEIKLKQIDAITQFLMLDKESRVDFKKLYSMNVKFGEYALEDDKSKSSPSDKELYRGIKELEARLKEEVIDDLYLPVDLVFSYYENEKLLGILPLYDEDKVASILPEFESAFS